ncbi:hypothetical protein [Rhodomicrobium sp. R_RK_3]|nr:hypothetical protein [Rhodomicrobium sp. R_RK_3]
MSRDELDYMVSNGRMLESNNNGVTPNSGAYRNAPPGNVFAEFQIPSSAIGAQGTGWAKIYGPNSLIGSFKGILEMPPVKNIKVP